MARLVRLPLLGRVAVDKRNSSGNPRLVRITEVNSNDGRLARQDLDRSLRRSLEVKCLCSCYRVVIPQLDFSLVEICAYLLLMARPRAEMYVVLVSPPTAPPFKFMARFAVSGNEGVAYTLSKIPSKSVGNYPQLALVKCRVYALSCADLLPRGTYLRWIARGAVGSDLAEGDVLRLAAIFEDRRLVLAFCVRVMTGELRDGLADAVALDLKRSARGTSRVHHDNGKGYYNYSSHVLPFPTSPAPDSSRDAAQIPYTRYHIAA